MKLFINALDTLVFDIGFAFVLVKCGLWVIFLDGVPGRFFGASLVLDIIADMLSGDAGIFFR